MKLYCGIDLHSNNSVVSIVNESDRIMYEKRLPNDLAVIGGQLSPYAEDLEGVVVESTYNWYWLVDGLMDAEYRVHLANTAAIVQYSGLKHSDDESDARHLAHLLRLGILPEGYIYPRESRGIRDLLRRRRLYVQQRTAQILSLQSLMARETGQHPGSQVIKQLDGDQLVELLGDRSAIMAAQLALETIAELGDKIKRLEQWVMANNPDPGAYELLTSIPGVGPILGLTIQLETGDIARFKAPGNYASYARCVRSEKLSNHKLKGRGNAKNGNKYLGWAFVEAGHYAAIWNAEIKRYYQRRKAKKPIMVAKKALANKLARACYHMLTRNEPFEVNRAFQ